MVPNSGLSRATHGCRELCGLIHCAKIAAGYDLPRECPRLGFLVVISYTHATRRVLFSVALGQQAVALDRFDDRGSAHYHDNTEAIH